MVQGQPAPLTGAAPLCTVGHAARSSVVSGPKAVCPTSERLGTTAAAVAEIGSTAVTGRAPMELLTLFLLCCFAVCPLIAVVAQQAGGLVPCYTGSVSCVAGQLCLAVAVLWLAGAGSSAALRLAWDLQSVLAAG